MNNTVYKLGFCLQEISQDLINEGKLIKKKLPITPYLEAQVLLENLSLGYIVKAFEQFNCTDSVDQEPNTLLKETDIALRYTNLVKQLLQKISNLPSIIAKESIATTIESYQKLLLEYPCIENELALLNNCGPHIRDTLQDKIHPLQLLFPNGDLSLTQNFYQYSIPALYAQSLLRKCIELLLQNLQDNHTHRILEIGAGVGSTAKLMLDLFKNNVEYTVTDISRVFLKKAQDILKENSFIKYQLLNIEQPDCLSLSTPPYSIVIASNVLHATASINESLANIRSLLGDKGILLLYEETKQRTWLDISFGLTDGWWRFSDYTLRKNYPLLSEKMWIQTLNKNGFNDVMTFSPNPEWTSTIFVAMKS